VDSKRLEGLLCNAVQLPLSDRLGIPADPVSAATSATPPPCMQLRPQQQCGAAR
jgi:hypothetical protein